MSALDRPLILRPGEGERVSGSGGIASLVKTGGVHTDRAYAVVEQFVPPGMGSTVHSHDLMRETLYVVRGPLAIYSSGGWTDLASGGSVVVPPGEVHGFRNRSSEAAVLLAVVAPSGLEEYFAELERLRRAAGGELDPATVRAVALRYDTHIVDQPDSP